MPKFKKLTIKEIKKETEKAVSIVFDISKEDSEAYKFIAGQYITLRTQLNSKEIRRSYSICTSPKSNELRIVVKAIKNGVFSNYAISNLRVGDVLEVAPPEGNFVLQTKTSHQKQYAAFVAGSGITPVMSMIRAVLNNETKSSFVLVYGNKSEEETIFKNEIDELLIKYPDQFFVLYLYSQKLAGDDQLGRIDTSVVNFILKNKYKNTSFDAFYICGPEALIKTVSNAITTNGFDTNKIHFELFTSISEPAKASTNNMNGNTEITVLLDDDEITFEMPKKQLILTAALGEGIDAPYSCQGGICSSCLAKVTNGTAVMEKNSILSDKEIEEGFILTCQAHPTSQKITVDFDDV